jgi:hypothetical protein
MRHPRRRWLLGVAVVALAAGCEQTLHLYQTGADGGAAGSKGGAGGGATGGVAGSGPGGRSGTGGLIDGGAPDGGCSRSNMVAFTAEPPQMLIALDRSTNMNQPLDSNNTHFEAAAQALGQSVGFYSTVTSGHGPPHPTIMFSFLDFPDTDGGCSAQAGCCTTDVSRVTGFGDFAMDAYNCTPTTPACLSSDHRPIAAALMKADQWAASTTGSGGRYVVLITDGPPSGNCVKMYDDCTNAEQQAMNIMRDTNRQPTVLRIGGSSGSDCLIYLAGGLNSPSYFEGFDYGGVSKAVADIMSYAVCEVTLTPPLPASQTNQLQVNVGTKTYQYDPANTNWTYGPTSGRLRLHGAACDAYAGTGDLHIFSGCEPGRGGAGFQP